MIINIAVIVIAGMIAYIWSSRGFFSGFLHMLCVIIAGALAFAFWEPLAHWMLGTDPTGGAAGDLAWGVSLGVPFAIMLTVLRVACDKLVPFNLDFDTNVNVIGGGVCGLVSGTITAGILIMTIGYTHVETEFLGHKRLTYGKDGSIKHDSGFWFPADWLTCQFYSAMSDSTFLPLDPDKTLGRLHPDLADENWMMRMTHEDGKGRNTTGPDSFDLVWHYTVTADNNPETLFDDHINDDPKDTSTRPVNPQSFTYLDGKPADPANSTLEGYVVKFEAGAKEQSGRVVVGASQIRLVVQKGNDPYDTMGINPMAVISQADNRGGDALKDKELGRWRYEGPNTFIPQAKEGNECVMGFEFAVPKGARPIALYVKGIREDVSSMAPKSTYSSAKARDAAVKNAAAFEKGGVTQPPPENTKPGATVVIKKWNLDDTNLRFSDVLSFNVMLQKDIMHDLLLDDTRAIIGGSLSKFGKNEQAGWGTDRALQVRKFAVNDGSSVVQVRVDEKNNLYGFLSKAAAGVDRSGQIALVDTNGQPISPVGYVYKTDTTNEVWIYFNPQAPVMNMQDKDMPIMSSSRPDQELVLIFWVSKGTKIAQFKIGDRVLAKFEPPVETK
ncbi:MAG TPA: CvpA family protein [Phycisphaerales bacterium]|jgi:hypothetical protein|nr:CvpA family protein [Phycisphaerales bacterium]